MDVSAFSGKTAIALRLVHINGSVVCGGSRPFSYWGYHDDFVVIHFTNVGSVVTYKGPQQVMVAPSLRFIFTNTLLRLVQVLY